MITLIKGSIFLEINDAESDEDYFLVKEGEEFLFFKTTLPYFWHYYEVISQTDTPLFDDLGGYPDLKSTVEATITPDLFFEVVKLDILHRSYWAIGKRMIHWLQFTRMYETYKNTGVFEWVYNKEEMLQYRRLPFEQWSRTMQDDYIRTKDSLLNDYSRTYDEMIDYLKNDLEFRR